MVYHEWSLKGSKGLLLLAVAVFSLLGLEVWAADLPGASDYPMLKRFGGSEIVGYDAKRFEQYELQTSTFKTYNLSTKRREFVKPPLKIEGTLIRIWYEAAGDISATELLRNYTNELQARKFAILYDSTQDPAATHWSSFLAPFSGMDIRTSRSHHVFYAAGHEGIRVASARLSWPKGDVYVYLIAVEWDKDDAVHQAKRGAYIAVDIVEVKPMNQNMVVISADEMSKSLAAEGRVALYGIYFDSNKAGIRPESKPTLVEVAKLLKKEPGLKLRVVGHTDSVGGFEFNLTLSKKRADAVVAALVKDYGIAAKRLITYGVSYLAPVASNATEEGRAMNRRVELVPW